MSSLTPQRQGDGRRGELSRRWEHPIDLFHQEFDALFDRFFGGAMSPFDPGSAGRAGWGLDVAEEGNETVIRADLPGFEPDDIDVRLDNGVLTIQAEEKGQEGGTRSYRHYYRAMTLPANVDAEQVRADYRNGVLELRWPRSEQAQGRRIPIGGRQAAGTQASSGTSPAAGQQGAKGHTQEKAKAGAHGGKA